MCELAEGLRESLGADRVLITEVTSDRQYVLLRVGKQLPGPLQHSVPLSHSICQHVIGMRFPLSVDDAFVHPLLKGCPAITDLRIGAYLGFPLGPDFPAMALCALCMAPRTWTAEDRYRMTDTMAEIVRFHAADLRGASAAARRLPP